MLYFIPTIFYILSFCMLAIYFLNFKEWNIEYSKKFLILGFTFHLFIFLSRWFESEFFPVTTLFESLSFFAMIITGFQIIIDLRYKVKGISLFTTFLSSLIMFISLFLPRSVAAIPPILDSLWLPIHVFFAFLGNGIFAISFCVSVLYLIQYSKAKGKKLTKSFFEFPSLETLDGLNYKCLTIGFPTLTLGIITGSIWASVAWGAYWSWDPKETWSLITWFFYAALLHGRLNSGWQGRKGAIFSIIGFLAILFTFLGVNLFLPGLHSYVSR